METKRSFWTTLPGILTGIAAVITAATGLYIVLNPKPPTETPGISSAEPESPEGQGPPNGDGFRVIEALLRVDPFDYTGRCPVTLNFQGRISTIGGAGTVSYRFIRSDNASAPVQSLRFDAPGSKDVSETWTLGGPGTEASGWEAVTVLEPQELESTRAEFRVKCQ